MKISVKSDLKKLTKKLEGRTRAYVVEVMNDLAERIVVDTPVDTGFLQNSWWASLDLPEAHPGAKEGVNGGRQALSVASVVFNDTKIGDTVYFLNGATYARRIENGWSRQKAPQGMVAVNVNEIDAISARVIARLKR